MSDMKEVRLGALVKYTPVERGDYGAVLVMSGPHKGKIAYYDDDDDTKAIIYFGVIGEENLGDHRIKHEHLAKLPDDFVTFVTTYVPPSWMGVELTLVKKDADA